MSNQPHPWIRDLPEIPRMDLRDYFAAAALQGIMHSWGEVEGWEHNVTWAYKYADAMLKARREAQP